MMRNRLFPARGCSGRSIRLRRSVRPERVAIPQTARHPPCRLGLSEEAANRCDDLFYVTVGQMLADRQAEKLSGVGAGARPAPPLAQIVIGGQIRQRDGIMDARLDPVSLQVLLKRVALRATNDEQVIGMTNVGRVRHKL